jgi:hypothetical protein
MKFLVTCIEAEGLVRGQTVKTAEEAERMFNHFCNKDPTPQYVEVRHISHIASINRRRMSYENPIFHSVYDKTEETRQ